jgi:hypothetical protein
MQIVLRLWLPCLGASVLTLFAETLQISNRPPNADEIGYRPADGWCIWLPGIRMGPRTSG